MKKIKVFSLLSVLLLGACLVSSPLLVTRAEDIKRHVDFEIDKPPVSGEQGYLVVERNDVNEDGEFQYDVYFWNVSAVRGNDLLSVYMDIGIDTNYIKFSPRILSEDGSTDALFVLSKYSNGVFNVVYSGKSLNPITIDYFNLPPWHMVYGAYAYGNIGSFDYDGFCNDGNIAYFTFSFGKERIPQDYVNGGLDFDGLIDSSVDDYLDKEFNLGDLEWSIKSLESYTLFSMVLASITSNVYVTQMLVVLFIVALACYVIFGRKG